MNLAPPTELRHLVADLPAHRRRAASAFLSHGDAIHSVILDPLRPPAQSYQSLAHFYLLRGRPFRSRPLTGRDIAILEGLSVMDLSYLRPGACFRNAILVADRIPDLRYAEGIGIHHGGIMLHAWLDLGGIAIDVTWPIEQDERPSRRFDRMLQRIDANLRHWHYWGITIPQERVRKTVVATEVFGPILTGGHGLRPRARSPRRTR